MQFKILAIGSTILASATAWNTDVHNQIGFMAETFLTPETTFIIKQLLEPAYDGSIGRAAAWADSYRKLAEGAFSYQWHWIDSLDTVSSFHYNIESPAKIFQPPAVCNTYYNRDCTKGGCIVSAIANQSMILRDCIKDVRHNKITAGQNITCSNALKWVVHFVSDLAQPLHTSNLGEGGNAFNVSFGGKTNNSVLHSIWDGAIIYSRANKTSFSNMTIDPFFTALTKRIRADNFFTPTQKWLQCSDPSTPVDCALNWASDSNIWNCDYVYSQNFSAPNLLTSGYFTGAYPIVEIQTSKAALRLATWLNKLVAGRYDKDREVILRTNPAWHQEL
jgi:hypothetical protein